tara:strand:+ start:326 stop:736 length:411 start_codon:yes stop_codon:yes gene_type:complete
MDNSKDFIDIPHYEVDTVITCDIYCDDNEDNFSDSAIGVSFKFEDCGVGFEHKEEAQMYQTEKTELLEDYWKLPEVIDNKWSMEIQDLEDVINFDRNLGFKLDKKINEYVCGEFDCINPEYMVDNVRINYEISILY